MQIFFFLCDRPIPGSGSPIVAFSCKKKFMNHHTKFNEPYSGIFKPYSDVLKPYSGVLELDFPKIEFHAFFFFKFLLGITRFFANRVFH